MGNEMTEEDVIQWLNMLMKFFAWIGATFFVVILSEFVIHVLGG